MEFLSLSQLEWQTFLRAKRPHRRRARRNGCLRRLEDEQKLRINNYALSQKLEYSGLGSHSYGKEYYNVFKIGHFCVTAWRKERQKRIERAMKTLN